MRTRKPRETSLERDVRLERAAVKLSDIIEEYIESLPEDERDQTRRRMSKVIADLPSR